MADAPVQYTSGPFTGPFSISSQLIRSVTAAPYEGLWIPAMWSKFHSIELSSASSFSAASVGIYAADDYATPPNEYTVTVGGTITAADVASITLSNPNFRNGTETVSYTVQAGDTTSTIATALAAAINADATLAAVLITATASAAVVTVSYPTIPSGTFDNIQNLPLGNFTTLSTNVTGSATETLTVAVGTNGTLMQTITAPSFVNLQFSCRWIKARLTTLTGSNAIIDVNYSGVA